MKRGFAAVFIASLILIQVGSFTDSSKLNYQMNTITKDHEQGHEDTIILDILLVGNSYTSHNDLNIRLESILDVSGENSDVESVTGGGMKLSDHSEDANQQNSELNLKLSEGHDYVILQDQSQVPSFPTSSEFWIDSRRGFVGVKMSQLHPIPKSGHEFYNEFRGEVYRQIFAFEEKYGKAIRF